MEIAAILCAYSHLNLQSSIFLANGEQYLMSISPPPPSPSLSHTHTHTLKCDISTFQCITEIPKLDQLLSLKKSVKSKVWNTESYSTLYYEF
jgi:hypothetical protein